MRLSAKSKRSYEKAIICVARDLKYATRFGLFYNIDLSRRLEIYVDADFAGLLIKETLLDPNYILSWSGFAIFFFRYPLFCYSELQTKVALSTTDECYSINQLNQ